MNIEDQELLLKKLNEQITKKYNRIKKIPFGFLRDYAMKGHLKRLAIRDEVWRNLREATRDGYPERMIGSDYKWVL